MVHSVTTLTTVTRTCDWCPETLTTTDLSNGYGVFQDWREVMVSPLGGLKRETVVAEICPKCFRFLNALAAERQKRKAK